MFMRLGSEPDMSKSRSPVSHDWEYFSDGLKRVCKNTGTEQWVFENRHPSIGQPRYEWRNMYQRV